MKYLVPCKPFSVQKGFTFLELIISIAILGIIMGFAVPSYVNLIENNKVTQTSGALADSLRKAKHLAIEEKTSFQLVQADGDWSLGWKIVDGNGSVRYNYPFDGDVEVLSSKSALTFTPQGTVKESGTTFTIKGSNTTQVLQLFKLGKVLVEEI